MDAAFSEFFSVLSGFLGGLGLEIGPVVVTMAVTWAVKKYVPKSKSWIVMVPILLGGYLGFLKSSFTDVADLQYKVIAYATIPGVLYNVYEAAMRRWSAPRRARREDA